MGTPCSECGRVNPQSPSDYFCSDVCQQHWYAKRTVGYPVSADTPSPARAGRWRTI